MYPSYFPMGYQPVFQQPQPVVQNVPPVPVSGMPTPDDEPTYVNGLADVNSWVVQRGQRVYLFDRNQNTFYVKSVSENGMPNPIEIYDYNLRGTASDHVQGVSGFNPEEYVKREELDTLKEQIKSLKRREVSYDE